MNDTRRDSLRESSDTDAFYRRAETLCDLGLYLQVQPMLEVLESQPSTQAQLLAARARNHLGARRAADAGITRLWRQRRDDARTIVAFLRAQMYRRGPQRTWVLLNRLPLPAGAVREVRADWYSLHAFSLAMLRDFERAQESYARSRELAPAEPWTLVEWSYACEIRDRYDEGIAAAQEALRLRPGYRAAIQSLANLQILVGREAEAMVLLERAHRESESGSLAGQLLGLQFEQGRYAEAWTTLERCVELQPLADRELKPWLRARRIEIALRLGNLAEAQQQAAEFKDPFHQRLTQRIADDTAPRRVQLDVGFVRQHYLTCAPATLAALSRYWSRPAEHLEIAERICYDGTPNHSERRWAETQGFITREFTVDWKTTCALLDAGVPFTLMTVYTGGAHLQAVIGYDALRGTLLIRDPFQRVHGEFSADDLFASHRSSGPRGMLLIPPSKAHRLDGIELPETALWDGYHEIMSALNRHDRDAALQAADRLATVHEGHRLATAGRRAIAMYDGDENATLAATEKLLEQFPADVNLQLSKAASLALLDSRARQLAWLAGITAAPNADPIAVIAHARLLADDGRRTREALRMLDRALRRAPSDPGAWQIRANLLWQSGQRDFALDHYRIAACLQETNEDYTATYFRATHAVRKDHTGLDFVRRRAQRLGSRSSAPVITLFQQLEMLERTNEAFTVLDDYLARRPDDAPLLIFAADTYLRYGHLDRARDCLERCDGTTKRAFWLHTRAQLARENGDTILALSLAREAAELEPFNLVRHRLVASILAQTHGGQGAITYLRAATQRFPHHSGLHEVLIEWLGNEPAQEAEAVIRHLVEINPSNAWAHRELAINLGRQNRLAEAWASAQTALEMAPGQSVTHSTLGFLCIKEGRYNDARRHLRDALTLSIDNAYAIQSLIGIGGSLAERQEALAFIRAELVRQVTLGDSLLAFQGAAQTTLEPQELLAVLREALAERSDLWQSWVAVGSQLTDMGDIDEALTLINQAIERFPLLPRLHFEQGRARALKGEREAARDSLRVTLQMLPYWTRAVRTYVDTVLDEGRDLDRALTVLDNALHRNPDDADLRALKAWVSWRMERRDDAVAEAQHALRLDPQPNWVWEMLQRFASETGDAALVERVVADVTGHRPGDAQAWIKASEFRSDPGEALAAAERALQLEPRSQAAYVGRLSLLLRQRRYDEIAAALAETPWGAAAPIGVRVFAARVCRARGEHREAFDGLRALLAEDPNHYALWQELADWADQSDNRKAYREAAEHMCRLAPNAAIAHAYLGHALLKYEDRTGAQQHFQRAFELEPAHVFSGLNLADLYLDSRDTANAGRVLTVLTKHVRSAAVMAREVRLATLKRQTDTAIALAREVFDATGDTRWACQNIIQTLTQAALDERLEQAVLTWFSQGPCGYAAVRFWIERQGRGLLPGSFYRDMKRALRQDPAHALKRALLDYIGERRDHKLLRRFVYDYRKALAANQECWAMVGYAYLACDQYADVINWMQDWRRRPDTPSWALDNLAVALRSLRRHDDARVLSLRSLELAPGNLDAKTWLAVDAARRDNLTDLQHLLDSIPPQNVREFYQNLLAAMQAYLHAARTGDSRKALAGYARLAQKRRSSVTLRDLMRTLGRQLVTKYTPPLSRPWRWIQLVVG